MESRKNNRIRKSAQVIILGVLFVVLNALQGALPYHLTGIKGIISQIGVILSVYMVVALGRPGYLTAAALNIAQFLFVVVFLIFIQQNSGALPGLVVPLTTLLIIRIIRASNLRLGKRNEENLQQRKMLEQQAAELKKMAYYDALTNTSSLDAFLQKVSDACALAKTENTQVALAFIDLDNFKYINDTMGHAAGDEVLRIISERLLETIHPEDTLGRVGGDEFALLIPRKLPREEMVLYLSALISQLKKVRIRKDVYSDIRASVGVAYCHEHAGSANDLLHCADMAMYQAKTEGKGRIFFYEPAMQDEMDLTLKIEQNMLTALEKDEFHLLFQPQYRIADHQIVGFEALLRWDSPALGAVGPDRFIPVAEKTGMINAIGKWVLREACRQYLQIREKLPEGVSVSVNISPVQLAGLDFVQELKDVLSETGMSAADLMLEITESTLITNLDHALGLLTEVKDLGVGLSMDDFGKGYSSLHYLLEMPIDVLKIDRSYIHHLVSQQKNRMMVTSIIRFAHFLGFTVVAEGVEKEEELDLLREMGCDRIQGFLWGRPMPIRTWIPEEETGA